MIKLITLIPRKPGMSREEFIDYYEKRHAPLTQALFPQAARYVRNYPTSDNLHYAGAATAAAVPFDAVTEHWFADQAAYDAMMADFAADPEKFRVLSEDEARFCDKERMVMFLVEERPAAD